MSSNCTGENLSSSGPTCRATQAGMSQQAVGLAARYCSTRSSTFEVKVDADVAGYHREFFAILGRAPNRDVQVLSFYWK